MIVLLALLWQSPSAAADPLPEIVRLAEQPLSGEARLGVARSLLARPGWEEAGVQALVRLLADPEAGVGARDALVLPLGRMDARPAWAEVYEALLVSPNFPGRDLVELRRAEVRLLRPSTRKAAAAELDRLLTVADPARAKLIGRAFLRAGDGVRAGAAFSRVPDAEELQVLAMLAEGKVLPGYRQPRSGSLAPAVLRALADPTASLRAEALAGAGYAAAARLVLEGAPASGVGRQLAELYRAEGRLADATVALQAYRRAHRDDDGARLALVDVYIARQKFGQAQDLLTPDEGAQAAQLQPRVDLRRAWESKSKRGLPELLEAAWRASPNDAFVAREWAKARLAARHPEESLPVLGQLLDVDPSDADALGVYNLAAIAAGISRSAVHRNLTAAAAARTPELRSKLLASAADLMSVAGEQVKATGDIDGALDAYLISLLVAPPSGGDLMGAAGLLWQAQHPAGATELFGEVLRREPGNVDALVSSVRLLLQAGRETDALRMLETTSIRDIRVSLLHTSALNAVRAREARAAARAGELESARVLWEQLAAEYPRESEFLHGLADALAGLGEYPQALARYEDAVELNPKDAWAVLGQANCLIALLRPEEARARLVERYPEGEDAVADEQRADVVARAWRATAAREQAGGATLDAFEAWRAAFELEPEVWSILGLASLYQLRGQPEVALVFSEEALALAPNLEEALLARAMALESLARWEEALAAAELLKRPGATESALARRTELVRRVVVQRSEYIRRMGQPVRAMDQLRATIGVEGESSDLRTALAASALDAGDCHGAAAANRGALLLNPQSRWALRTAVRVAQVCRNAPEMGAVIAAADRAAGEGYAAPELRLVAFELHIRRAERLMAGGAAVEAARALGDAEALPGVSSDEYARLGGAWITVGNLKAALVTFDHALLFHPGHVPSVIGKAGALRAMGNLPAAEAFLSGAWNEGRDPRVGLQLVQTLIQRGKYDAAELVIAELKTSALPPEPEAAQDDVPDPLPVLRLPSGRLPGPRTHAPLVPQDIQPRWLVLQLASLDADLARERSPVVMVGAGAFSKSGDAGEQQLFGWVTPVEAIFPPVGLLRFSAAAVVLGLDDGEDQALGVAPSVAVATAPYRRFFASARVGTSPLGFPRTNVLWHGHARFGALPGLALGVQSARTPISDSLLSWAGKSVSVADQEEFYGFVSGVWFGAYASWTPSRYSLGTLVRGGFAEGFGVEPNAYVEGVAWANAPVGGERSGVRVGGNLVAMHHERQEDGFSVGDGGYFSPPVFVLALAEVTGKHRFSGSRGAVCGNLGAGTQYLDGMVSPWFGGGLSGTGRAGVGASWRLAPQWSVGVDGRLQASLAVAEDGTASVWHQQSVLGHLTWGLPAQGPAVPSMTTVASSGSILPDVSTVCRAE